MALGLRPSGADLPPLGSNLLWVTLSEPRHIQSALEDTYVLGVKRNSEVSRGSSAVPQHCLTLKGNSDQ